MSPVRTATRSARGKASRVFSSKVVFPEPGELIKFRHSTPFCRKRSRSPAASRSFSLSTFFSSGTRFMLLQLQVRHLQFVAADALVARASAFCAAKIEIFHIELGATVQAAVPARTKLNLQFQALEFRLACQDFKCELQ